MEENVELHRQWMADIRALAPVPASQTDSDAVFYDILARHTEPHRRYHDVSHLETLFALLARYASHLSPGSAPRLAVWWHDAIYDSSSQDNEARSAALASRDLKHLGASGPRTREAAELIRRTRNHWEGASAGDGDFFLDADIAILGAEPDVYDAYVFAVREEYKFAPDAAWRAGRSAFLKSILARPRVFRTEAFETAFGNAARSNIERELCSFV